MPSAPRSSDYAPERGCGRRDFLRSAAAWPLLAGGLPDASPSVAVAPGQDPERSAPEIPPNAWPPAMQFQAYPGGTGAYCAQAAPLPAPAAIEVAPWQGPRPASPLDLAFQPVHRLAALVRARLVSPVELTELYLERLARLDEKLVCVVHAMADAARAEARQAEAELESGQYRGPLHGIPYGIKDLFATAGAPTSWGAKPFEDRVLDEDAAVVRRLRDAGAILIAKLSLGTFARGDEWFRGRTRNPWNPEQGSSGSSAGSAAAVAAGCVGFALGTETRGSIVSPARRCGITALRPTFGRVSRAGAMTLSWSMDKVGPLARSVEDCALVFAAIHGVDPADPSTIDARFAFQRELDLSAVRIGHTEGAPQAVLDDLAARGARLVALAEPPRSRDVGAILTVESAAAFDDFLRSGLDEKMVHRGRAEGFRRAQNVTAVEYLHAQRRRLLLMQQMARYLDGVDLYVSASGDVGLTNLTGHPAVVLPYAFERGQPRCVTLVGQLFADDLLLSVARAYQEAHDWHLRRPDLG